MVVDELDIVALGAQGDGIATTPHGPRHVAFALPGERVRVTGEGGLPEIVSQPSPERAPAICRHFGTCGGCVAQHVAPSLYASWKRESVVAAFRQRGLSPRIELLVRVPDSSRRRAVFTFQRRKQAPTLGYHRRRSDALFDVVECPVLSPQIVSALPGLREIVLGLELDEARVIVLAVAAGLDVAIETAGRAKPTPARLVALAERYGVARISIDGEIVLLRGNPVLRLGDAALTPPPGAFVQAVAEAEQGMVEQVLAAAGKAKRIADLFCGIGTFSLPLARAARVLAVDGDRASISALDMAVRLARGLKPVEARVRDLFRNPLLPRELEGFDAVVFDPPRAGARAQAEMLAKSGVRTLVAVSCNPATLARDVRMLVDGGYRLDGVVPIDQFLYSYHVECVAVLRRD